MSIISGPFLCFECSKPKKIVIAIHRLYSDKQQAQERIKKIKEIGYKNAAAIDL
jgi:DNA polymerase IIIc chi subunit